jgi:nucleotide-binding universal stress UspA family protein
MAPCYIAGFDDSSAANAALGFTRRLARTTGARVVAGYVYPDVRPVPSPFGPDELIAENPDLTAAPRAAAARLVSNLPDDVEVVALAGVSVPHELDRLARIEHAALLAVGQSHRGRLGRLLPGSIGERVVHGAPCPVLVVPDGHGERAVRSIAVAYDGGEQSRRALRAAASLAGRLGAALVLIGVSDPIDVSLPHVASDDHDRVLTGPMRELLEHMAGQLRRRGFDVTLRLPIAVAGRGIVAECADGVDLLVAGSSGHRPAHDVFSASVARYLVDHAPCPVLVVPAHATLALVADEQHAATAGS